MLAHGIVGTAPAALVSFILANPRVFSERRVRRLELFYELSGRTRPVARKNEEKR
jgi:hypothetical protein